LVLLTSAGRGAIRDVFIFVEDGCELTIEPAPCADAVGESQVDRTAFASVRRRTS
jgi:hypothetical protein